MFAISSPDEFLVDNCFVRKLFMRCISPEYTGTGRKIQSDRNPDLSRYWMLYVLNIQYKINIVRIGSGGPVASQIFGVGHSDEIVDPGQSQTFGNGSCEA